MNLEVIHKSLHRPVFFMGVDRELGMTALLIAIITAMGGYSLFAVGASVCFWFVSMHYLRKWTKSDALIRDVFLRHIRYINKGSELFLGKPGVFSSGPLYLWKRKNN
jgi:Type IV secretory pathway, TrbD component